MPTNHFPCDADAKDLRHRETVIALVANEYVAIPPD
jgi:hypothetical protein